MVIELNIHWKNWTQTYGDWAEPELKNIITWTALNKRRRISS